ncbi:MAG TPA: sigma-54 dependent transcriptional regulator [Gemmatimonadaceae bacterium]|nr:sigma-54 dependent transcriptional regulator [Gemmatimonadaceae bacterium]
MATIVIIDDEVELASSFGAFFERSGHQVVRTHTGDDGIDACQRLHPDLVLLDLKLPDVQGFELLDRLHPDQRVIIIVTGHGDIPLAVEAMRRGAENFLTKPVELPHLGVAAERALEKARLRELNKYLIERRGARTAALLGSSPAMRELAHQIDLLASAERTTVLLIGESGTGKGRVAEAIHTASPRASRPFVELSCAGLSAKALEIELFGQEAAGAGNERRLGLFEVADGGTLFLDEIGALDPAVQPKLLKVMEGRSFRRVGGTQDITVDVRVIAATIRDLASEVVEERFREDLYYRLSVMPVHLPPLRARAREDMLDLVARCLEELHVQLPEAPMELTEGALDQLLRYSWPGNVRELRNVLERAMIVGRGARRIGTEHLPPEVRDATGAGVERHVPKTLDEVERAHIERTLRAHNDNRTRAARELGISRATLINKIRTYGLGRG